MIRTEYWSWIFILVGCKADQVTCSRWERNRHCIPWQEIWIWRPKRKHTGELSVGLPVRLTRNLPNSQISHAEHIYSKTNTWELMPATNSNRNEKCYQPLTNFYWPLTQTTFTKHILTAFTKHIPTTYQSPTKHIPTTYQSPTKDILTTLKFSLTTSWPQHLRYRPPLSTTYWPPTYHSHIFTDHITFPTDHILYQPPTNDIPNTCQPHTDHIPTTYQPPLPTTFRLPLPTTYCTAL